MDIYAARLASVQENLKNKELQMTVVSEPYSVQYLIDRHVSHLGERLMALCVPMEGKPTLFVNELFPIAPSEDFDIVYHNDNDTPTAGMAEFLPSGKIGIDRFLYAQFLIELMQAREDITPVLGSFAVERARMIKDETEQEAMRYAAKVCDEVFAKIPGWLEEGMTELALSEKIALAFKTLGDPSAAAEPLVCFGPGAAEPHHTTGDTKLKPGDVVLVDAGQTTFGYTSDMTRTFFYKTITEQQREVYEIVREANRLARLKVAAGVPFSAVDAAARKYITAKGYGQYFTHRTGHNIGMQMHEQPDVSGVNHKLIQAGMCFSIEPGIYLPGKFGVRVEDIVIATEDGCETLNKYSKEIQEIE